MPLYDAECRLIVIAIRKEIEDPLRSIAEISQSAKHLYAIITRRENIWTEDKEWRILLHLHSLQFCSWFDY